MIRCEHGVTTDYADILALNEAAIPAVNRIDGATLADLHRQAAALIVARAGETLAGFLLALDEGAEYGSLNFQFFRRRYDRFAYVDRIVVDPEFRGGGVGRQLYATLFAQTVEKPRVTCEVNLEPPNPGSLDFHRSLGFEVVGEQDTEGGSKRVALMVREMPVGSTPAAG